MKYRRDLMKLKESKSYAKNMKLKAMTTMVFLIGLLAIVGGIGLLIGSLLNWSVFSGFGYMYLGVDLLLVLYSLYLFMFRYKIYQINIVEKYVDRYTDDEGCTTITYYVKTRKGRKISVQHLGIYNSIIPYTNELYWVYKGAIMDFYIPGVTSSNRDLI